MEDILADIQSKVEGKTYDQWVNHVQVWSKQFRQRGISILALEELINFYSQDHFITEESSFEAFVDPDCIETPNDEEKNNLRNLLEKAEKEIRKKEKEIQKYKRLTVIVCVLSTIFLLVIILLVILH